MNKHLALLCSVVMLSAFGLFVCVVDVHRHGVLHVISAIVGGGSLMLAVALALPLRMKEAVSVLSPILDRLRPTAK